MALSSVETKSHRTIYFFYSCIFLHIVIFLPETDNIGLKLVLPFLFNPLKHGGGRCTPPSNVFFPFTKNLFVADADEK